MSTDDVKEHNEKVLRNLERNELVAKFADSIGCTDAQAATISKAYADRFVYDGATLSFNGKPVIEAADDVKAHFKTHGLDFLLPAIAPDARPDVDPKLLASARAGHKTSQGQLFMAVGKDRAMYETLLAEKPKAADEAADNDPALKGKSNPWSPEWCGPDGRYTAKALTEQGRVIKTLGLAVASRIADKYARIGATRPNGRAA
jgi:hypothetical protein